MATIKRAGRKPVPLNERQQEPKHRAGFQVSMALWRRWVKYCDARSRAERRVVSYTEAILEAMEDKMAAPAAEGGAR